MVPNILLREREWIVIFRIEKHSTVQAGAIMIKSKASEFLAFHLFYTVLEVLFCGRTTPA